MPTDISGLNPAHLLPLTEKEEIDEDTLREHINSLDEKEGINGFVSNAHASEGATLTIEEQLQVIEIVNEESGSDATVISGLGGGSTKDAIKHGNDLSEAGADALLVFPPHTNREEEAVQFHKDIANSVDLPLIGFQHPANFDVRYERGTLTRILNLEDVIGVKLAAWEVSTFEADLRAIEQSGAEATVLTGNDEFLMPCYALGDVEGGILGLAAVLPDEINNIFNSIDQNDLNTAREVYDRINPFVEHIYDPEVGVDSHTKLKVAMKIRGEFPTAIPRRPALPIKDDEVKEIESLMDSCGLL